MEVVLLVVLVFVDLFLLGFVYILSKTKMDSSKVLEGVSEERKILDEMRSSLKEQAESSEVKIKGMIDKVTALVTEAEVEHKEIRTMINETVQGLVKEIEGKFVQPLEAMEQKISVMDRLSRKTSKEKEMLLRALKKGEEITKFFNGKIKYEELLEEIEDKKYSDARLLIAKGLSPEIISRELNMPESEVRLLASVG